MRKLPKTPSKLLTVALNDLRKVEKDRKHYQVNMGAWHSPSSFGQCGVCLAGSVLAMTCKIPITQIVTNGGITWYSTIRIGRKEIPGKLFIALDMFRCGFIDDGLRLLGFSEVSRVRVPNHVHVPDYRHGNTRPFKNGIKKVIRILEKAGL